MSHHDEGGHQAATTTPGDRDDDRDRAADADRDRADRDRGDGAVAMPDDPDALRLEIADTRRRLGDTVHALAQKADVKSQVKEQVAERKQSLREARTTVSHGAARAAIPAAALVAIVMLVRRRR